MISWGKLQIGINTNGGGGDLPESEKGSYVDRSTCAIWWMDRASSWRQN